MPDYNVIAVPQQEVADVAKIAIREFIQKMGVIPPQFSRDIELEARVKDVTNTWPFESRIRPHIITALMLVETIYSHLTDMDTRVAIVLYSALLVSLDSPDISEDVGAANFYWMLCDGSIRDDKGIMGELNRTIADMGRLFTAYSANTILYATLLPECGDGRDPGTPLCVQPETKTFVQYQRHMSSIWEAYVSFIWSKTDFPDENVYIQAFPDAFPYIALANDILSFYKEELDRETAVYIHARAHVTGRSPLETLQEVIDEVIAAIESVEKVLGQGPARDAWESFKIDFISFHVGDPRYFLQEIISTTYMIDMSTL